MTSASLRRLAESLRMYPALAYAIANRMDAIAEDVAILEAVAVPNNLRAPTALPEGVISLAEHRRKQA
jgi:hypothetical protein